MATGDYYILAKGVDQLMESLADSKNGIKDLRTAWREIAEDAAHYVRGHVPVYGGQYSNATKTRPGQKDGRGHPAPGGLRDSVKFGATKWGPWVSAGNASTPYLHVQEFGGTSFWHKGGAGLIRKANRRHKSYAEMGSWGLGQGGASGHPVYEKPRERRGYFIWNSAFRLRSRIGLRAYEGIGRVCQKHGLPYEMPANTTLDIPQQSWRG